MAAAAGREAAPDRLTILADDLTGAADCVAPLAGRVVPRVHLGSAPRGDRAVVAYDLDTRDLPAEPALERLRRALGAADAGRVFLKIDSTGRGHLEDAVAAMVEAAGGGAVVVCPAFPALGRTFVGGRVLLDGVPVEETAFGRSQNLRPGSGDLAVRLAARGLGAALVPAGAPLAGTAPVLLADASSEAELEGVARAALADPAAFLVGSAGLARGMRGLFGAEAVAHKPHTGAVLFVIGSGTPLARAQMGRLVAGGAHVDAAGDDLAEALAAGGDVLLSLPEHGEGALDPGLLDGLAARLPEQLPAGTALVLSGGATARRVLTRLGVGALDILGEIAIGVPVGVAATAAGPITIVLKAGGFGTERTLADISHRLRRPNQ